VEYRKSGKLVERLNELTAAQAEKAMAVSNRRADGGQFGRIVEQRVSKAPKPLSYRAPHIQHYGVEHGLQRYRCAGCGRTFDALAGKLLARLRKKEGWASFANSLKQSPGEGGWRSEISHLLQYLAEFNAYLRQSPGVSALSGRRSRWSAV
jgi:hypothetical protein